MANEFELEFPYRLKGWHAFALTAAFIGLPLIAVWLSSPGEVIDDVLSIRYGFL